MSGSGNAPPLSADSARCYAPGAATLGQPGGEADFRLDHFRDGVTVALIVWRDLRDGTVHDRATTEELKALTLLDWITQHPSMELISSETR